MKEIHNKNEKSNLNNTQIKDLESYCPFCHTSFSPEKAAVLGEGQASWLLHVTCCNCSSSIVLLLLLGEAGVSSYGLVTDLLAQDIKRFHASPAIAADDLLELYDLLHRPSLNVLTLL